MNELILFVLGLQKNFHTSRDLLQCTEHIVLWYQIERKRFLTISEYPPPNIYLSGGIVSWTMFTYVSCSFQKNIYKHIIKINIMVLTPNTQSTIFPKMEQLGFTYLKNPNPDRITNYSSHTNIVYISSQFYSTQDRWHVKLMIWKKFQYSLMFGIFKISLSGTGWCCNWN